jgi:hypothetical protein
MATAILKDLHTAAMARDYRSVPAIVVPAERPFTWLEMSSLLLCFPVVNSYAFWPFNLSTAGSSYLPASLPPCLPRFELL